MKARTRLLLLALLLVFVGVACQNTERAAVQPEKLASSSPSTPASGAPFGPFASGYGPQDLKTPSADASSSAAADSSNEPEFNPDGDAPTPAPVAKPAQPATSKPKPGIVKLIKAGQKPHQELRFTAKVGDTSGVEMVMTTEIKMEIDGKKPPSGQVPPIVFIMQTQVTEVTPEGDIRYKFNVAEAGVRAVPGVRAEVITALNQALGSLVGLTGTVLVSNRGITKETKLSLPGKASAQTAQVLQGMEQAMQQLGAPLPEEPVGRGAQWTHTTTMSQNGITLTQVATYNLLKVSGNKISCKIGLTQTAPKQKVNSPVGVVVDLLSLNSKGGGTSKLRLDRLTPIKSKMKVSTKANMGLPKGQKMKMDSTLTVEMGTPKKKPKPKTAPKTTAPAPAPKGAPAPAPKGAPAPAPKAAPAPAPATP